MRSIIKNQFFKSGIIILGAVLVVGIFIYKPQGAVYKIPEARAQTACVAEVDVIFAIDTSGSMGDEAATLCDEVINTINTLDNNSFYDVKYGVYDIGNSEGAFISACKKHIAHATAATKSGLKAIAGNAQINGGLLFGTQSWTYAIRAIAENGESAGLWRVGASRVLVTIHDDITKVDYATTREAGFAAETANIQVFPYSTWINATEEEYTSFLADFDSTTPNGVARDNLDGLSDVEIAAIDAGAGSIPAQRTAQHWIAQKTGGDETFEGLPTNMATIIGDQLETILLGNLDADGDGSFSAKCMGVCPPGATCDDYYDAPSDIGPGLTMASNIRDSDGSLQTVSTVLFNTQDDLDHDGFPLIAAGGNDIYENPADFGYDLTQNNIIDPFGFARGWLQLFKAAGANNLDRDTVTREFDIYENPLDFGLDVTDADADANRGWFQIFQEAGANNLDKDSEQVACGRVDVPSAVTSTASCFSTKDWYDNPFTPDLLGLGTKPTLEQLSHTINDLDLDTFVAQAWKDSFNDLGINVSGYSAEPDEADITIVAGENRAGCTYPGALEERCVDCTAHAPDPATGRVPPTKTSPAGLGAKDVCQIEAYYLEDQSQSPPYTIITSGPIDPAKSLLTASVQCKDEVDNDLDGLTDGEEISCPKAGGLVPCGRESDDPTTLIDETQPCSFCHFFFLFTNIINWIMWRIMPVLAVLFIVLGGFLIVLSRGNPAQFTQGKNFILWPLVGYAVVLVGWVVINSFFSMLGIEKWTGIRGEGGNFESVNIQSAATELQDNDKSWEADEWKDYVVTINHPDWPQSEDRRVTSNTVNEMTIDAPLPNIPGLVGDTNYTVGGWWQFSCGLE